MGDSSETLLELRNRPENENEAYARSLLQWNSLLLDENSIPWILDHIDCFVSQSRGSESRVRQVFLFPHAFHGHDDDIWDKVGQGIGNLQTLGCLIISNHKYRDDNDEVPIPSWDILARILSHVRQKVKLVLSKSDLRAVEEVQALARAIRGHPTITSFEGGEDFPYESLDALYSALVTLPALELVKLSFSRRKLRPEDESTMAHHDSLTELLRVPSLRSVRFDRFSFTPDLCQATANALMEGTSITSLDFCVCSFPVGECAAILANAFSKNASLSHIKVTCNRDGTLCSALTMALPSNSTLHELWFYDRCIGLSPVFSALEKNTELKSLKVAMKDSMDESLCAAMQTGLEANETLESLELNRIHVRDDNADLWFRALSFLRTNKALKSLVVTFEEDVTESCVSAFRFDIAAMLQENASLESLFIQSYNSIKMKAEDFKAEEYFVLVTALQHNTTLKSLKFHRHLTFRLNDDEDKQLGALLKKNYALERLPDIDLDNEVRDVGAILLLNEAGRRYLIQDGSSISKGVEVLSRVNNDINCVFLHLLENPVLCDRSAVVTSLKVD
jgi:hypothetical protein